MQTGRLYGRIGQMGRIERRVAGQICGIILADFVQKGPKKVQIAGKFVFFLLFSLILGKSKKYYTFPSDIYQYSFVSKGQMPSKM
jgi:hypothetical protein